MIINESLQRTCIPYYNKKEQERVIISLPHGFRITAPKGSKIIIIQYPNSMRTSIELKYQDIVERDRFFKRLESLLLINT